MDTKQQLIQAYGRIRAQTEAICSPLMIEDYVIQSMEDVSPPKWHLAHTTWFFETFLLIAQKKNYHPFHPTFSYLFNSYYQKLGSHLYPRVQRGVLSRPTVDLVYQYRHYVDAHIMSFINESEESVLSSLHAIFILGLHHEQQHQELLMMDIKHNFSLDPNFPIYQTRFQTIADLEEGLLPADEWLQMEGGMIEMGHQGNGFCFDNELPRHRLFLHPYLLATQLVTNEEYLEFIEAGGYKKAEYWLADGWDCVQKNHWQAPLYWLCQDNKWYTFTLSGLQKWLPYEPVSHVSYYEADAFARFRKARLPTEMEWEHVLANEDIHHRDGHFLEDKKWHPHLLPKKQVKNDLPTAYQFFGDVWEWTRSAYHPYPGYKPLTGALGEYNGKFMSNQFVLRGGSCFTPRTHIRASYRNFFQPDKRWQVSGIRLANDVSGKLT